MVGDLLDPHDGAVGLERQLRELVELLAVDAIDVVDVGGDIVATGHEPELRSPLGDSLTLASVQALDAEVHVLVAGPGIDGELTEVEVLRTVSAACRWEFPRHPIGRGREPVRPAV